MLCPKYDNSNDMHKVKMKYQIQGNQNLETDCIIDLSFIKGKRFKND